MILYHGSNTDIAEIDLSVSKVGKDFGCGFYLSADKEQALELAARKTEQLGVGCAAEVCRFSNFRNTVGSGPSLC